MALIKEGINLGKQIWITNPEKLTYIDGKVYIMASKVIDNSMKLSKEKKYSLDNFDLFFIRQDPPFDMNYISNCYLLELHKKNSPKPFFINDPSGIKNFTEKIFPLYFSNFMPNTMVTSNIGDFEYMLDKSKMVVIKPLYCKGGEGIYKLSKFDTNCNLKFLEISKKYKSPIVVQKYLDKVKLGDKRVIFVDGTPEGVVNRIPKTGSFKANLHLGGKAKKTKLTKKETTICSKLGKIFKANKLFLVGIDLIDQKLTEINVTSPTGITQIDNLYNTNLSKIIWDKLEKYIV